MLKQSSRSRIFVLASFIALLFCSFSPNDNPDKLQLKSNGYNQEFSVSEQSLPGLGDKIRNMEVHPLTGEGLNWRERIARNVVAKKVEEKLKQNPKQENTTDKSQIAALIIAIFVGGLGIHRFYLGYTGIGIIQLLTLGGCGIWALIDIIRIATGELKPKDGDYGEKL